MSRTVSFYNYTFLIDNKNTDSKLINLINSILDIPWDKRLRVINNHPTGLFELKKVKYDKDNNFLIAALGQFRQDYKPFIGAINTQRLKEINDDVIELVFILVDTKRHVLMLEYNQHGLRAKGIEEYFTSFLPQEHQNWELKLHAIYSNKGLKDIAKSQQVRAIEIRLKLSEYEQGLIKENVSNTDNSKLLGQFLLNAGAVRDVDARTLKLEFGAGNSKTHSLDIDSVMILLDSLNLKSDAIDSLKVRFRDSKTQTLDIADLKNSGGQLKDKIFEDESVIYPTLDKVGKAMASKYMIYEDTLQQAHLKNKKNQIHVELPKIIIEPPTEYKVETIDNVNK